MYRKKNIRIVKRDATAVIPQTTNESKYGMFRGLAFKEDTCLFIIIELEILNADGIPVFRAFFLEGLIDADAP